MSIPLHRDRPIVGIGLKMFLDFPETMAYLSSLRARVADFEAVDIFVLPSFPTLPIASLLLVDTPIALGAQDGHWEHRGPFTGCVSPVMLRQLGCSLVEVGHAERRRLFDEDDSMVSAKVASAVEAGLEPIVCVGERELGPVDVAIATVTAQVKAALGGADSTAAITIAYEPVWAIGKDRAADPQHVRVLIAAIREELAKLGREQTPILYGGSVDPSLAGRLGATGVDGLFVGRSALNLDQLVHIAEQVVLGS